ncbi:hypothetical protein H0X06_07260, partial [Candidatus Dependentiae bacterium]|nr:hypothetical protein [Candidatus Dependentiae bacterium]
SNMGVVALIQAMKGIYYNEGAPLRFYCADTIDDQNTGELFALIERELSADGVVVLCIATKSGTTTETLLNGSLFYESLKRHRPKDYQEYIVIITDEDSPLCAIAKNNRFELLLIPSSVGGRYSLFSSVGLFPLMMMGIDIGSLLKGAQRMFERCMNEESTHNPAALSALTLFDAYQKGYTIYDTFVFSPSLALLGQWYKQLIGESLGKKYSREGTLVERGIGPTVSIGTVDLHSVVQLYLAGPRTRITTFLYTEDERNSLTVPDNLLSIVVPGLANRTVTFVKSAIFKGVLAAYEKEQRPYMLSSIKFASTESVGEFAMMKMIEIIFLARLFSINAFDQPAVELYKEETRRFMQLSDR